MASEIIRPLRAVAVFHDANITETQNAPHRIDETVYLLDLATLSSSSFFLMA